MGTPNSNTSVSDLWQRGSELKERYARGETQVEDELRRVSQALVLEAGRAIDSRVFRALDRPSPIDEGWLSGQRVIELPAGGFWTRSGKIGMSTWKDGVRLEDYLSRMAEFFGEDSALLCWKLVEEFVASLRTVIQERRQAVRSAAASLATIAVKLTLPFQQAYSSGVTIGLQKFKVGFGGDKQVTAFVSAEFPPEIVVDGTQYRYAFDIVYDGRDEPDYARTLEILHAKINTLVHACENLDYPVVVLTDSSEEAFRTQLVVYIGKI